MNIGIAVYTALIIILISLIALIVYDFSTIRNTNLDTVRMTSGIAAGLLGAGTLLVLFRAIFLRKKS